MSQFDTTPYGEPDSFSEPRTWPKVLGIISIVWASLGLVCNGCTAISSLVQPMLMGMMPPEAQQQMQQQMAHQNVIMNVALGVLGLVLSGLLLFAGIQTMRYRPQGRGLHLAWAALAVVLTIVGGALTFGPMKAQMAAQAQTMQSDPNIPAAQAQQIQASMEVFAYATFGCTMLFTLAYPIFILIWFGLVKRRPEDMGPPPQEIVA